MHAVLITFRSAAHVNDLHDPFMDVAKTIRDVPGLLAKTWLQEGERLGGFYLFTDTASAEAYLNGAIVANLTGEPAFSDFEVRHFTGLEELSAVTRGVPTIAANTPR